MSFFSGGYNYGFDGTKLLNNGGFTASAGAGAGFGPAYAQYGTYPTTSLKPRPTNAAAFRNLPAAHVQPETPKLIYLPVQQPRQPQPLSGGPLYLPYYF